MLGTAEVTYAAIYGNGYSATLAALGPPPAGAVASAAAAGLIDDLLVAGSKSGYTFTYSPTLLDPTGRYNGYTILANPIAGRHIRRQLLLHRRDAYHPHECNCSGWIHRLVCRGLAGESSFTAL